MPALAENTTIFSNMNMSTNAVPTAAGVATSVLDMLPSNMPTAAGNATLRPDLSSTCLDSCPTPNPPGNSSISDDAASLPSVAYGNCALLVDSVLSRNQILALNLSDSWSSDVNATLCGVQIAYGSLMPFGNMTANATLMLYNASMYSVGGELPGAINYGNITLAVINDVVESGVTISNNTTASVTLLLNNGSMYGTGDGFPGATNYGNITFEVIGDGLEDGSNHGNITPYGNGTIYVSMEVQVDDPGVAIPVVS